MKSLLRGLTLVLFLAICVIPSFAQVLYENGPINGQTDAWTINFGFIISDTFTISGQASQVGGMSFGAWLTPGDTLESTELIISSQEVGGGTVYFDGQVNITQSGCSLNQYSFDICTETAMFNGPTLNTGTYWVSLENAVSSDGDPVYWDENSGIGCHSEGCPSEAGNGGIFGATLPSESFSILGTQGTGPGSTPEPGSLVLFASGILAGASVLRRKLR